jgi:hypothetical protein
MESAIRTIGDIMLHLSYEKLNTVSIVIIVAFITATIAFVFRNYSNK